MSCQSANGNGTPNPRVYEVLKTFADPITQKPSFVSICDQNYGPALQVFAMAAAGLLAAPAGTPPMNANPITAKICQQVCDVVMTERPGESEFVRRIRAACLNSPNRFPAAAEIASELGLSLRTFHRRLSDENLSYQSIVDEMRRSLATELLENTHMGIDQVAERVGFADATSFRKAFKKWTNHAPSDFRPSERSLRN